MTTYAVGQLPSVPGPPPALRGKADGGTPPARVEPRPETPVAPVAIPHDMPDVASETTIPADGSPTADGAPGGDPNGSPDGVSGGVGSGPRGGVVDAPGTDVILRPGGDVTVPVVISRVDPEYPDIARRSGLQGIVELECIIGRDGTVRESARRPIGTPSSRPRRRRRRDQVALPPRHAQWSAGGRLVPPYSAVHDREVSGCRWWLGLRIGTSSVSGTTVSSRLWSAARSAAFAPWPPT